MGQITTVTLNAAIDKTYFLERFPLGKVTRAEQVISSPGGKGINVARVIRQLGSQAMATGFVGGTNGEYIVRELSRQGIPTDFVFVDGESRLCLNMIDLTEKTATELLEPGPAIREEQIGQLRQKVAELAEQSSIVAFSGSLPKGVHDSIYAELIEIVRSKGAKPFLDTSGSALAEGVKAKPFLIKPNEYEIEKLIGGKLEREEDLYDAMRQMMAGGIACVVVTLGAKGAIAGVDGRLIRIRAPKIDAVNPVGSGDSFVAGAAVAIAAGQPIEEALRLACACGTANALNRGAGEVRREDVDRLREQVIVEPIRNV
jgi:tagatose 6-phosphate kinase